MEKYILKLIVCAALLYGSWGLTNYLQYAFSYYGENAGLPMYLTVACRWICVFGDMLFTTLFGFFVLLLGMKIRIGNKFRGLNAPPKMVHRSTIREYCEIDYNQYLQENLDSIKEAIQKFEKQFDAFQM